MLLLTTCVYYIYKLQLCVIFCHKRVHMCTISFCSFIYMLAEHSVVCTSIKANQI